MTSATTPRSIVRPASGLARARRLAAVRRHAEPGPVQGHRRRRQGHLHRPRAEPAARAASARSARAAPAQAAEPDLPFELRQVVAKYPVTLYTASGTCEPCVAGAPAPEAARHSVQRAPGRQRAKTSTRSSASRAAREAPTLIDRLAGAARLRAASLELRTSTPPAIRAIRGCRRATSTVPATPIVERREPRSRAARAAPGAGAASAPRDRGTLPDRQAESASEPGAGAR